MNIDVNTLYLSILFSSIGMGYFIYGKKSSNYVFLISGIILMGYTYFINNFYYSLGLGIFITFLPFLLKKIIYF